VSVARFWSLLPRHDLQLASGKWFGESDCVFRLGFGYLPPGHLGPALSALSTVLDAATAKWPHDEARVQACRLLETTCLNEPESVYVEVFSTGLAVNR
jgi:hypothetical protein